MTFTKKLFTRPAGRHALRTPGAEPVDGYHRTESARTVLAHTTTEWNALRHAC
jgi:hypothetical protein